MRSKISVGMLGTFLKQYLRIFGLKISPEDDALTSNPWKKWLRRCGFVLVGASCLIVLATVSNLLAIDYYCSPNIHNFLDSLGKASVMVYSLVAFCLVVT